MRAIRNRGQQCGLANAGMRKQLRRLAAAAFLVRAIGGPAARKAAN
jgi:hypothetical protein